MAETDEVDDLDLADLMLEAIRSETAQIHTSMPGCVIAYNHNTQRATIQPSVRFARKDPDTNEIIYYKPAPISGVPIAFGTPLFADTFPLAIGDPVTLIVAERSIDEWLGTGNVDNTPQDPRRHDPTDAIAIPGPIPGALPSGAVDPVARVISAALLKLGSSSASDFVALAQLVLDNLDNIDTALGILVAAWNVIATAGGGPLIVPPAPGGLITPYSASSVAATKVQAE